LFVAGDRLLRRLVSVTRRYRIFCRDLRLHRCRLDVRVNLLDVGIGGDLLAGRRLVARVLPLERSSLIGVEDAAISVGAAAQLGAAAG
jgi:hypothetical protein